jgi:hypothetical protein
MTTELFKKIFNGLFITNEELAETKEWLRRLIADVEICGPDYALFRKDLEERLRVVKAFQYSRMGR